MITCKVYFEAEGLGSWYDMTFVDRPEMLRWIQIASRQTPFWVTVDSSTIQEHSNE
jgi:hypothetical protein